MAVYNEVQVGRYVRFIQKLFSIKGRQPAPLQYAGELGTFLSLFHGVENRYLEQWDEFYLLMSAAAGGAGFRSGARLRNPLGSNVMAVFEKITFNVPNTVASNPAVTFGSIPTPADLVTPFNPARGLDRRTKRTGATLIGSTQNNAALAALAGPVNTIWQANTAGDRLFDVILTENQEIPFNPGDAIQFDAGIDNTGLSVMVRWRERTLEESELA